MCWCFNNDYMSLYMNLKSYVFQIFLNSDCHYLKLATGNSFNSDCINLISRMATYIYYVVLKFQLNWTTIGGEIQF